MRFRVKFCFFTYLVSLLSQLTPGATIPGISFCFVRKFPQECDFSVNFTSIFIFCGTITIKDEQPRNLPLCESTLVAGLNFCSSCPGVQGGQGGGCPGGCSGVPVFRCPGCPGAGEPGSRVARGRRRSPVLLCICETYLYLNIYTILNDKHTYYHNFFFFG